MKKIWFLTLAMAFLLTGCRQTPQANGQMTTFVGQKNNERTTTTATTTADDDGGVSVTSLDLLNQRVGRGTSEIMLTRKGYMTSYNKRTRTPNWVAWNLTKKHTYGNNQRANERFEEDPSVPEPRATFQDFYNSRYDRGHMCPAGDNKWDEEAMTESFLMTNICPQNHGLNKEDWNNLEIQCRTWARRFGEVTIVCGPLFEDGDNARLIGRNKVRVPTGFFKVVYRASPEPHAVGFIFKNNGSPQPWRDQLVSVDEVEERTGFNFFHKLPDKIEDVVEAEESLREW